MIEKINERLDEEVKKILSKEELSSEEIQILITIKNDLKFDEKMKKMIEFTY